MLYQLSYAPGVWTRPGETYNAGGRFDTEARCDPHHRPSPPQALHEAASATDRRPVTMASDPPAQGVPLIRTALVVDDAGVVRRLSFRILSEAGYRVFEAAGAVEAIEVLAMLRGNVDLILVDVIMPEVNGVDLVHLIRDEWDAPAILFMSAYPAEVLAREGLKDLRVQFLAKPFTRGELLAAADRALALHAKGTAPRPRET